MNFNIFRSWSLKSKLTILISAIFFISIWSLAFYASRVLHKEMRDLAGEQQFSAASFIAADINQELATRLKALEIVSSQIKPSMLKDTTSLQAHLEQHLLLQVLFNGGIFATGTDGIAIADVPLSAERIGVNYMDRTSVSVPLKEGKSMIGRPAMGKKLGAPIFSISVPIRDTQGTVIGVLLGTINLNLSSFLDEITNFHYGKTGGYLLVAPQYEVVVTATDKRRVMTPTSRPGAIPLLDRFRQGYEGSGVLINPLGVEVLASAKGIPVAGWYVVAALPTTEAFAPIHKMQNHILLAAILLTLIAAGLTLWILRGLLAPLFSTVEILSNMTDSRRQLHPLPIARQDEIGKLIGGFNYLLAILSKREEDLQNANSNLEKLAAERTVELQESEQRFRLALRNSPVSVAIQDRNLVYEWAYNQKNWRPDEIIGKTDADLFAPEEVIWINEIKQRVLESGTEEHVAHWVTSNGQRLFLDLTYEPLRNSVGEVIGIGIAVVNLTNQKLAEEEARQLHEVVAQEKDRLSALVSSITDEIWFADSAGNFQLVNPSGSREFNLNTTGAIDVRELATSLEVLRSDGSPRPIEEAPPLRALRGEVVCNQEEQVRTPATGELRHRQVSSAPVRDAMNNIIGSVSVVRDITEHRRTEETLRKNEKRLGLILQASSMGTFEVDLQTGEGPWNDVEYELLGLKPGEAMGNPETFFQHVHPDDIDAVKDKWEDAMQFGKLDAEFRIIRADGQERWVAGKGSFLYDGKDQNQAMQFLGVNFDITDRKQAEEQIKASLAEKEVMLKEIHHRVKNNLQVISSLVSLQADNLTDERMRDELNDVRDRVRSMALIHEKLYQTSDLAQLNFADYATSLLRSLWHSHGTLAEKVRLNLALCTGGAVDRDSGTLRIDPQRTGR